MSKVADTSEAQAGLSSVDASLERWLAVGLCLGRTGQPSEATVVAACPWVRAVVEEAPELPPVGLIVDVGGLLQGRSPKSAVALTPGDPRLERALAHYDEQLLGRLVAEPRLEALSDAMLRLPEHKRPKAVALVIEHLLSVLGYSGGAAVRPAVARRLLARPAGEIINLGLSALRHQAGGAEGVELLARGYEELVQRARHVRSLLSDALVFAIEHLEVLGSRAQRLAAQQMVSVAESLDAALPKRLRRMARRRGTIQTQVEDDSQYPIGGFSAISTSGSLENLVSSELVYMDPPCEKRELGIDLFDVRYAEGELLYYTRDESAFCRNRRLVVFVLDPSLVSARFKDQSLPAQRVVLAFGLILCAVRRLSDWLQDDALELRVLFHGDTNGILPLGEERELAGLLLREWIDKGVASVREHRGPLLPTLEEEAAHTEVDVLVVASTSPDGDKHSEIPINYLDLGNSTPVFSPHRGGASVRDGAVPWDSWVEATRSALQHLL